MMRNLRKEVEGAKFFLTQEIFTNKLLGRTADLC